MQRILLIGLLVSSVYVHPRPTTCVAVERSGWSTSRLIGTPTPPPAYAIRPAFELSFDKPTSLTELPGGDMMVTEIGGNVYTFRKSANDKLVKRSMLQIEGASLWHATHHPEFARNRHLFVCYSKDGVTHVSRYEVDEALAVDPASEVVLLTWPAGGHNAGCIRFGKDGMLYIATGDGSGPNPPDGRTAAQDVSNLFGCILRIDVNVAQDGKPYGIPDDNPFAERSGTRPEIWSFGLRNPWKFGVDSVSGELLVADNGWETWEMVHRIVPGGNCGWPIMEGRASLRTDVTPGPTKIRPPLKDHHHSEANSVIGGPIYRGARHAGLQGVFVYGDYITGTIWGLRHDGDILVSHETLLDTDLRITDFAEGSDGELWVLDYDFTGKIYEIVPSGLEDLSRSFPRKLSETGIFKSLRTMEPADGVVPYDVVASRWMDGMKIRRRWVAIPGKDSIQLAEGGRPAAYPEGTAFVKHIVFGWGRTKEIPVETQVLHLQNGNWNPYTYRWGSVLDEGPLDAELVDPAGAVHQVPMARAEDGSLMTKEWHSNAVTECRLCHNAGSGYVLGFNKYQLDRPVFRPPTDYVVSQLDRLAEEKTISAATEVTSEDPGRLVDPHDVEQNLDDRARSYLHANCASCHHPRGNAIVSFYLKRDMPFDDLRTNKGTGIGTFGMDAASIITPGDPYRSVLMYRMTKLGYGRMPYVGSRVVDSQGVALIEDWILAMQHADSPQDTAVVTPHSAEHRAIKLLEKKLRGPEYYQIDRKPLSVLMGSTEGALAVALGMHSDAIREIDHNSAYRETASDIAGLFEDFVPLSQRRKTLGPRPNAEDVLRLAGDKARGQLIFASDAARCRNCHHADDASLSTGPTLADIRKKYQRRSELLTHVLQPSLKIDDKYASYLVVTSDGKVVTGLLLSETDDHLTLRTAERETVRIAKDMIDEMEKSEKSLMPAGILADLTAQEAADLLQWFGDLE